MPKHITILALLSLLFFGCKNQRQDAEVENLKPRTEGHPGELLVVLTPDQSKSVLGKAIEDSFTNTYYVITPQPEPVLKVITKTPEQYQKFFRLFRNILRVNIGQSKKHETPKISVYRDLDARDQLTFEISANSRSKAAELLKQKKDYIIDLIEDKEIERLQTDIYNKKNTEIISMLESDYGINLQVPAEFEIAEKRPDFVWLRKAPKQLAQDVNDKMIVSNQDIALEKNIFIYTYPYTNDSTFTPEFLFNKRDTILKYNVPGTRPNTYMGTEYGYGVEPHYKEITHRGDFAVEIKGIWKLINGFMGGPFVSLTKLDKKNNRIVTVEGNIYAPHTKKREYIRSMEAIVKTLNFDPEEK